MTQARRPSNQNRPRVSRPGSTGLRFGMFAVCVARDSDPGLNKGKAKPLYSVLISFADVSSRDTEKGYPYRASLAAALDCSKQTVDRAAKYLQEEIGLVTVHPRKVEGKPDENDANLYEIHDAWLIHGVVPPPGTPPQLVARYGHTVPGLDVDAWISEHAPAFDLPAWRAAYDEKLQAQEAEREEQRRKERARQKKPKKGGDVMDDATPADAEETGGSVTGDATGGVTGDVTGGVMGDALSRAGSPEPSSTDDAAPSGRSPAEPRRASTGSTGSSDGGSAAPAKSSPAPSSEEPPSKGRKRTPRLTGEERSQMKAILQLLPPDLLAALGDTIPTTVGRAMVEALAAGAPRERTPEQLVVHRLLPRWNGYWAPRFYAGELTPEVNGKRRRPFGPLLAMLKDTPECNNLTCEDRHDFVLEDTCRNCAMRKTDRAADREREQRAAAEDAGRQAPQEEGAERPGKAVGASVPRPRRSLALHTPQARRECAVDSCALALPEGWEDTLCRKCRNRANRVTQGNGHESQFASAGPAPF